VQAVALTPPQVPPQAVPSVVQAARVPRGAPVTVLQVPALPTSLQALHCPVQAVLQQTPSTQKPEAQPLLALQLAPAACFGVQVAPWQKLPVAHWASLLHVV
jgi:hypothetical protein